MNSFWVLFRHQIVTISFNSSQLFLTIKTGIFFMIRDKELIYRFLNNYFTSKTKHFKLGVQ